MGERTPQKNHLVRGVRPAIKKTPSLENKAERIWLEVLRKVTLGWKSQINSGYMPV